MLYWRIRAERTAIEGLGGPWSAVGSTVAGAAVTWLLPTVPAVTLAELARSRRLLLGGTTVTREPTPDGARSGTP